MQQIKEEVKTSKKRRKKEKQIKMEEEVMSELSQKSDNEEVDTIFKEDNDDLEIKITKQTGNKRELKY